MRSTLHTQSPKALLEHVRAHPVARPSSPAFHIPFLAKLASEASPSMIAIVLLLAAAETLVLISPQLIPAWCALGAVISTVFVFVHEKHTSTNIRPGFLFLNALCTLFAGIALPRPVLTHWLGVADLATWYPESFVLVAALCGLTGFTTLHTIYLLLTGELPSVIRSLSANLLQRVFPSSFNPTDKKPLE
jgi:hypothetical protein